MTTYLDLLWTFLNSPVGVALVSGLFLMVLGRIFTRKPEWETFYGLHKDKLVTALNASSYPVLRTTDARDRLLEDLRKKMNDTLSEYGVEPRIRRLYWDSFHFD